MSAIRCTAVLVVMMAGVLPAARAADLTVRLDAREVVRKHMHTELSLAVKPGPLTLVYPAWIPGEHGPTGPINTVIGMVFRANGQVLAWKRDPLDVYAISLEVPAGASRLEVTLDSGLPVDEGSFTAGPTSSAQLAVISWNQFVLLPRGVDAETISTEASILAPPEWHLACALDLHAQGDGSTRLEGASLARLIDSPLQMGRYVKRVELQGSAPAPQLKHAIVIAADSENALTVPADFGKGYDRMVAQAGMLFGSRMYRHYTWLLSLSDHVAHFGLEHHESSDDRVDENSLSEPAYRERVGELLAHEYVHSWNGKYRRPAGLLSPDYDKDMDGSLLWVYEGMTQFWGEVLPVRSGISTAQDYREVLASKAGDFDVQVGSHWRPLADTAVAAQILYDAPAAWTNSRRSADFYEASEFLWLNVDAELRKRSGGRYTLDDFVRRFYAGSTGQPALKPYVEEDIYAALSGLVAADWRAIIRRHLDSKGPEALLEGLKSTGWQLTYTAQKNSYLETRQKWRKSVLRDWSIGFSVDRNDLIIDTVEDRAAARAGLGPGMKLVAVNGRRYTAEVLDAAILEAQSSKKPIELLVQSDDFYRTLSVPYFDGPRWPHLTPLGAHADVLSAVLKPRSR
jgi:predicted metalloprotease with PDZ domain